MPDPNRRLFGHSSHLRRAPKGTCGPIEPWTRPEWALPDPGQPDRIRHHEVVAQDHEDAIGDLAFDESASGGQRTPVESLVERSIHSIAEEHPDIRRLADVLRSPAHE